MPDRHLRQLLASPIPVGWSREEANNRRFLGFPQPPGFTKVRADLNLQQDPTKGMEMDLSRILTTAGQVLQGMSDGAVINNWLSMSDDGALDAIKAQVASSSVADIDRMDSVLLTMAATHYDSSVRARLIKFYTMFKIVEVLRFQEFRGFPPV
jgi:hypothetical protein